MGFFAPASPVLPVSLMAPVDAIDIDSCMEIDQPGEYSLIVDLVNRSENPCIDITASNVILDGFGHVIDGSGSGTGIRVGNTDVTVRNLTVRDWYYGIRLESTANVENSFISNNYYGLYSTAESTITGCTIEDNTFGGKLGDTIFSQNVVRNNKNDGLRIELSSNGIISSNIFENNTGYGLRLYNSMNLEIRDNLFLRDGVYIGDGNSENYYLHTFSNNTMNGKPLCYFSNVKNISVSCGGVIAVSSDNISIVNSNLSYADVGVFIFNTTNFRLENSTAEGDTYCLYAREYTANLIRIPNSTFFRSPFKVMS